MAELRKYVRMMDNEIKLVIHRAYLVRRTIAMVLITISLFFMSGMSALLAWYTSVFWWFSAICLLIGNIGNIIVINFHRTNNFCYWRCLCLSRAEDFTNRRRRRVQICYELWQR